MQLAVAFTPGLHGPPSSSASRCDTWTAQFWPSMGVCGSKRDLKLEEVTITEKPPAESHAAAENPAAETASGTATAEIDVIKYI